MWRTILLSKLAVTIVAASITGVICATVPFRAAQTMQDMICWLAAGGFFIGLAIALAAATFLLVRRR